MAHQGDLYIVATPIGNRGDMTHRAVEVLQSVDLIAAEDTRHSKKLLDHYHILTPTISYHDFSPDQRLQTLISYLQKGQDIALISDAGTPLISDPGYELVNELHQLGIKVIPIPGACALITALAASGLPTDRFIFEGFLPAKQQARLTHLKQLQEESRTIIFYESVHRIQSLLKALLDVFGKDRIAVIARELTKKFETIRYGNLKALNEWLIADKHQQKGEFVVLLHGEKKLRNADDKIKEYQKVLEILLDELSLKQAVSLAVRLTGGKKSMLYSLALKLKK